ncbi:hypothetical protein B0J18DRAFT_373123 [Chaetomium sp. MPI-SDFR-AT-0129]|uniref:SSCRP protein n=1 Tax=Dichotomopilus funicola TaxID=1934379 RepID=A0AAN6V005_9PEZI|nr:hypothetical protein B0J18DRAFT_373123 [Chaetomium sp. MPI-SDFR-AT-0129]KAK4141016.1 hypothetical protein C8A04DRAFT_31452 [Dichotomopilus funicola]
MKYLNILAPALGLMAGVSAIPLEERQAVQTVHLTFHAGPAEYSLALPADGSVHQTNHPDLAINIIDAPDYNAYPQCHFTTASGAVVTLASSISPEGNGQILVGPPTPIVSVSCEGMCVPTYGDCYGHDGQWIGPCCNGYCAADKCRPWKSPY